MKRIMNKVAVDTICFTVNPKHHIRIMDYPTSWALRSDETADWHEGNVVFDGDLMKRNYDCAKIFASEVYGVKAFYSAPLQENILLFKICMAEDQY